MGANDAEKQADTLMAIEKAKKLKQEGILIDADSPYSHNATQGGRLNAFIPRRIRSNNIWVGILIFVATLIIIELLT